MAVRVISTRLALDGEKEFKQQMSSVNSELRTLKTELSYTEAAFRGQANTMEALADKQRILQNMTDQQREKVRALEQALSDASEIYEEGNKRLDSYRQSLNKAKKELIDMEEELRDTDKYLDEARSSTDKCAKSIDGFGKEVRDAGDDLDKFDVKNLMGNLDDLKGVLAGGAVVGGVKEIADTVLDIADSTKEYRSIMGSLEVSSKQAGYTAEQTSEAYNHLYGVLGDAQTTATTLANLQAIGLSQEDLMTLIDGCSGAWAKYGDSIPIDSLAESINETSRAKQVTGTFADVINWGSGEMETFGVALKDNIEFTKLSEQELEKLTESERADYEAKLEQYEATEAWNQAVQDATTAEDFFNLALQACETQSDRSKLMLDFFREQGLIPLGEEWRNVESDVVAANEAQNNMEQAMGHLGEVLSPVADGIRNFGANAINWLAEQIDGFIGGISDAIDWLEKLSDKWNKDSKDRMERYGYEAYYNEEGLLRYREVDGSHAAGLDFVPFDGYTAELHYGERVMTAAENSALDTLSRAVSALEVAAHGAAPRTRETPADAPQTVTIPVRVVLNGRIVGEETTTYQMQQRRATGT